MTQGFESFAPVLLPKTFGFEVVQHICSDVSHRQDVSAAAHTALKCTEIQSRPNRLCFPLDGRHRQTVWAAAEMWSSFGWRGAKGLLEMVSLVRQFARKGLENLPC